jgi:hypothetical protein
MCVERLNDPRVPKGQETNCWTRPSSQGSTTTMMCSLISGSPRACTGNNSGSSRAAVSSCASASRKEITCSSDRRKKNWLPCGSVPCQPFHQGHEQYNLCQDQLGVWKRLSLVRNMPVRCESVASLSWIVLCLCTFPNED